MVIEKFLALSMIALGLTASAVEAQRAEAGAPRAPRPPRRRVRWLRQHLQPRSKGGAPGTAPRQDTDRRQ